MGSRPSVRGVRAARCVGRTGGAPGWTHASDAPRRLLHPGTASRASAAPHAVHGWRASGAPTVAWNTPKRCPRSPSRVAGWRPGGSGAASWLEASPPSTARHDARRRAHAQRRRRRRASRPPHRGNPGAERQSADRRRQRARPDPRRCPPHGRHGGKG